MTSHLAQLSQTKSERKAARRQAKWEQTLVMAHKLIEENRVLRKKVVEQDKAYDELNGRYQVLQKLYNEKNRP
jgi:hypothetical protein